MSDEDWDFVVPAAAPTTTSELRRRGGRAAPTLPPRGDDEEVQDYIQRIHEYSAIRLLDLAPAALTAIEEIMEDDTVPASVRQKAAADVLDRVGMKQAIRVEVSGEVGIAPSEVLQERLAALAAGRAALAAVIDGEVIDDTNDIDTSDEEDEDTDVDPGTTLES